MPSAPLTVLNETDAILLQRLIASVLGQARYSTDGVVEQKLMASVLAERLGFESGERQRASHSVYQRMPAHVESAAGSWMAA